jgi:cell division protein FtsN
MINKYIKELLKEHNRVIVPDLGAFLHKGESSKVLYFNEFLRFNDGLLLNYMAEQEKIDKIEAAKQIKAYVEETNKNLQAKKLVAIEDLGSLYLDSNDKIQLQASHSSAPLVEEPENIKPSAPQEEPKKIEPTESDLLIIEKLPEAPKQEVVPPAQPKPLVKSEIKENPIPEIIVPPAKTADPMPPAIKTMQKPPISEKSKMQPPPKQGSNKLIIWIASVAVLIIITLLYYFIVKPIYIDKTVKQNATINNTNLDTIVSTRIDSSQTITTQPEQPKKYNIPISAAKGKKYYLVVGCFVQENNADKVYQKLQAEGFSPEKFARIEHMYFVSIASFNDKVSANKMLQELKNKGYTEIWIKRY